MRSPFVTLLNIFTVTRKSSEERVEEAQEPTNKVMFILPSQWDACNCHDFPFSFDLSALLSSSFSSSVFTRLIANLSNILVIKFSNFVFVKNFQSTVFWVKLLIFLDLFRLYSSPVFTYLILEFLYWSQELVVRNIRLTMKFVKELFFVFGATAPSGPEPPHSRGF